MKEFLASFRLAVARILHLIQCGEGFSVAPKSGVKIALGSRLDRFQLADLSEDVVG